MPQRHRGAIIAWDDGRGFGFIRPEGGGRKLFFHINDTRRALRRPREHAIVSYCTAVDDKGRPCAVSVRPRGISFSAGALAMALAGSFILGLYALSAADVLPFGLPTLYLLASLVTIVLYRVDKSRAENGGWRTPEKVLHLFEFLGGWPGALIAQQHYRHKSRKPSYRAVFYLIVVANVASLGAYVALMRL